MAAIDPNDPDRMFKGLLPAFLLGLMVYGEARGEPIEGQVAVACVARKRAQRVKGDYHGVLLKPHQFSCFTPGDRNREMLERCTVVPPTQEHIFRQCLWVAQGVFEENILDNTEGADHYLTTSLLRSEMRPSWAHPDVVTVEIGHHAFLRLR